MCQKEGRGEESSKNIELHTNIFFQKCLLIESNLLDKYLINSYSIVSGPRGCNYG